MLMIRLERIDGEYILRVPTHAVALHDLREGQLLSVVLEPLDEFGVVEPDESERQAESWKLNETNQRYETGR